MQPQWSTRIGWTDLPKHVRVGIEQVLGATIEESIGQQGGFSPGTAERVRTTSGRRAFVKAVSPALNESSPAIYRKEAVIAAALPHTIPAASLIGTYDDGNWVALVLTDVAGHHPHLPWCPDELAQVLDALQGVAVTPVPQALEQLPRLEQEMSEDFAGWARLRADAPEGCDPWILENLECLERLANSGLKALGGDSLVHNDVRADNILITGEERAILVDWPWACIGAGWVDALSVLVNVRVFDATADVDSVLQSHPVFADATDSSVDGFLSGLGAYFIDAARLPAPPGLPTLRVFQQQQGEAVIAWLRQRLARHSG